MLLFYTGFQTYGPSLKRDGEVSQKWIKLSHLNGQENLPWKPKQEQSEEILLRILVWEWVSRLTSNREGGSLSKI